MADKVERLVGVGELETLDLRADLVDLRDRVKVAA